MTVRKRPTLKVVAHYIAVDGEKVEIDPRVNGLPDRCKIAFAEMTTGQKHELVESEVLRHVIPDPEVQNRVLQQLPDGDLVPVQNTQLSLDHL